MQQVIIHNLSQLQIRPVTAGYCASFLCRLRGLTFRRQIPPGWGLLLVQPRDSRMDSAIHMLAVWIDLAVVWINSAFEVVDVQLAHSWRPAYIPRHPARYVLEMDVTHLNDFKVGDQVRFDHAVVLD